MNVDHLIGRAVGILRDVGIVQEDENNKLYILKTFRGQISSFGAAITMGSLTSAVAFYSDKGGSDTDRYRLMNAIYLLVEEDEETQKEAEIEIKKDKPKNLKDKSDSQNVQTVTPKAYLLNYVIDHQNDTTLNLKAKIVDAAVALKLAMNAYELRDKKKDQKG
jgi:CRISPR-associated protein Cmr5